LRTQSGSKKVILIIIGMLSILAINGCHSNKPDKIPQVKLKSAPNLNKNSANSGEHSNSEHPYGKPFKGILPWEHNPRFKALIASKNMKIRMAAFQTTLPDPLPGEESNVALAADFLAGKIVKPGEVFR
jgi:hypothetical protein